MIHHNPVCRDRENANERQTEEIGGAAGLFINASPLHARCRGEEAYPTHQPEDGPGVLEEGDRVEADAPGLGGAVRARWLHPGGGFVLPDGR